MMDVLDVRNADQIISLLHKTDKLLEKSCRQVILLDGRIRQMKERYQRATRDCKVPFRASIRIRLEGLVTARNMMREYSRRKHDEMEELKRAAAMMIQMLQQPK